MTVRSTQGVIKTVIFYSTAKETIGAVGSSLKDAESEKTYTVPPGHSLVGIEMDADELSLERSIRFVAQKNF